MSFVSTLVLLPALKVLLGGLEVSPGVPAFEAVESYDAPDLPKALQDLRLHKNRVCLIIPDEVQYVNDRQNRVVVTACLRGFILIFADRDFGSRQDAMLGDASRPGVIRLEEVVVAGLTGVNLGIDGVVVLPQLSQPMLLQGDAQRNSPGRSAWTLELQIHSGYTKTSL